MPIGLAIHHFQQLWESIFGRDKGDFDSDAVRRQLQVFNATQDEAPRSALIEPALRAAALNSNTPVEIITVPWSQNPDDTADVVPAFMVKLEQISSRARAEGRPLYVAAHSWGTVLVHEALTRLAKEGRPVPVARLTTCGSPLVPPSFWVKIFKDFEGRQGVLQKLIAKPEGVATWTNLWGDHDHFSNAIEAADRNVQIDTMVEGYERFIRAKAGQAPAERIRADLQRLTNPGMWHESYFLGLHVRLASLGENLDHDILQENVRDLLPVAP